MDRLCGAKPWNHGHENSKNRHTTAKTKRKKYARPSRIRIEREQCREVCVDETENEIWFCQARASGRGDSWPPVSRAMDPLSLLSLVRWTVPQEISRDLLQEILQKYVLYSGFLAPY